MDKEKKEDIEKEDDDLARLQTELVAAAGLWEVKAKLADFVFDLTDNDGLEIREIREAMKELVELLDNYA